MPKQQSNNPHKKLFVMLFSTVSLVFIGGATFLIAWPLALSNASDQSVAASNELLQQNSKTSVQTLKEKILAQKLAYEARVKEKIEAAKKNPKTSSTKTSSNTTKKTTNTTSKKTTSKKPAAKRYLSGTKLKIPASATVLTLSGLNFNLYNSQPEKLRGIFKSDNYKLVKVNYPASIAKDSISKGVTKLDALLKTTSGQIIVLAQSQGAQVASRWMREHANDKRAPSADRLTFILTGNPLRSTGGYIIGRKEIGGTIGQPTPTYTKWPIMDIARRYDGWADWVKDEGNQWAVRNANAGKDLFHDQYDEIDIKDPAHTVWTKGNTTYMLTKEELLPMWENYVEPPFSVISAMRAHIEKAYSRPSNDPKVKVPPTDSWFWNTVMKVWGIKK